MSTAIIPTGSTATPLTKWKHALIVAGLTGLGYFLTSLVTQGTIDATIGGALGALVGEALTYEHSV